MGKYVINGKTYYFSKDADEDSHNKKNKKDKANETNKKRIKKQTIKKPKNVIKELIEKADSIGDNNYDEQIKILEEIYNYTKDLSIIRKYSIKYISACIKRRRKQETIEQFERLKSKFGASIFSVQILIEMTKMYCDVGNFIEARKIYYSAKRYDSGKFYDELKELDKRIGIHEAKKKPKKEKQVQEKKKIKAKIIWDPTVKVENKKKNKSSIEVRKNETEIRTIDFRSFVIRSDDYYECRDHDIEAVKAIVYIFDGFKTVEKEIPAFYCNECKVFYIKESTFELLKKYGRILCPIMTLDEYWEMKNNLNRFGGDWARKSVLKMYGYSASEKDNLSDNTRRTILEYIIDSNVLSKQEVVDYLLFFIRFHQSSKKAVAKWQSDIDYITGYKTDFTKKKVGIIYK